MKFSMRSIQFPLATLACLGVAGIVGSRVSLPPIEVSKQESSITIQADLLKLVDVGLHAAVADLMWVQTLIESDLEHYKQRDRGSWLYHRFNTIARLDRNFYQNYDYGGQYLMIVKDDIEGAEDILDQGLKLFPDDLSLNWNMGFLQAFERWDSAAAYPYYTRIKDNPGRPKSFDGMYARLSREALGAEDAYQLTYDSWSNQPEGSEVKTRLADILYSMKAEIDLACLNAGSATCARLDFQGSPYVQRGGKWSSLRPIMATGLHRRKRQ